MKDKVKKKTKRRIQSLRRSGMTKAEVRATMKYEKSRAKKKRPSTNEIGGGAAILVKYPDRTKKKKKRK